MAANAWKERCDVWRCARESARCDVSDRGKLKSVNKDGRRDEAGFISGVPVPDTFSEVLAILTGMLHSLRLHLTSIHS